MIQKWRHCDISVSNKYYMMIIIMTLKLHKCDICRLCNEISLFLVEFSDKRLFTVLFVTKLSVDIMFESKRKKRTCLNERHTYTHMCQYP